MTDSLKTYSVLFAEDVPHYGCVDIEAANDAAAIAAAKAFNVRDVTDDPAWSSTVCVRIVHIEDEQGNIVASDVPLDDFHLRNGGDADRRLCEAAPKLLAALTRRARARLTPALTRSFVDSSNCRRCPICSRPRSATWRTRWPSRSARSAQPATSSPSSKNAPF
jgi:hypothetical protein